MVFPSFSMHFGEKLSTLRTKELSPIFWESFFPASPIWNFNRGITQPSFLCLILLFYFTLCAWQELLIRWIAWRVLSSVLVGSSVLPRNHRENMSPKRRGSYWWSDASAFLLPNYTLFSKLRQIRASTLSQYLSAATIGENINYFPVRTLWSRVA